MNRRKNEFVFRELDGTARIHREHPWRGFFLDLLVAIATGSSSEEINVDTTH